MDVVVAVKQVPRSEVLALGPDARLEREGVPTEMSAYCRRALAKGIELARATSGRCTVVSVGPPSAATVARDALACGADEAILLSDPALAGSDTLVTARALAALLATLGRVDLVLVGKASLDAETGQVGPQLAELLDLPFAGAVRELEIDLGEGVARTVCELDDGREEVTVALPAVLAMAERSCSPARADPSVVATIPLARVRRVDVGALGSPGPWGAAGSPTKVDSVVPASRARRGVVLAGTVEEQVDALLELLVARGALETTARPGRRAEDARPVPAPAGAGWRDAGPRGAAPGDRVAVLALLEPGQPRLAAEIVGGAARIAAELGGTTSATGPGQHDGLLATRWAEGADEVVDLVGSPIAEDVARALASYVGLEQPEVLLAPSTTWGREVAARLAARIGAGLVGDVVDLEVVGGRLRGVKPACAGGLLATVSVTSAVQLATVRPGALVVPEGRTGGGRASRRVVEVAARGRVATGSRSRDDEVDALERASVVVGVGLGVPPEAYGEVRRLAERMGAELGATRKVTDRGYLPRSRQIGITGRNVAPGLYLALGVSGSPNHLAGVRRAGTVVAVNSDPGAPVLAASDVGIVADWRDVVATLLERLGEEVPRPAAPVA
ncbi:MAG: FAD-binding protein [Actinomycetota bacterium]|nr:FAD-binding protein [Actinomycetota bacterium]